MTFDTTTDLASSESPSSLTTDGEPVFLELDEAEGAPPAEEVAETAAPGWFSRKRAKSKKPAKSNGKRAAKKLLPAIAVRPEDQPGTMWQEPTLLEKLTYLFRGDPIAQEGESVENPGYQRFKRLLAFAFTGYGVSLILHTLVTAALAFIVVEAAQSNDFSLLLSDANNEVIEFDNIDTTLEMAGGAEEQLKLPQMQVVDIQGPETVRPTLPEELRPTLNAVGSGDGGADGDGKGLGFSMPKSGKAITKGSFTVWTVPEDPAPGQNYLIIIQVKLPKKITRYRRSDLKGTVVGTDGYRQYIPGVRRGYLPVKENKAQLAIFVPAAASLVRDRIEVSSRILKEKQKLEIEF
ncbi:MAG: hypothetical protein HON53_25215 [Planctomycetaceae bacterium]|nr:hypothetical protein [Planctomycetaceae bacterium]MBT6153530.1 hypothetical protein [Planctomycetaceae bacterium]MBT6483089.1 hypothetical protein [Planctomycetaceae bacterium]MBT6495361.1 hypothetical protein [Planctomycetaceae bacterium]